MQRLAGLAIGCCLAALAGCGSNGAAMRAEPISLAAAEEFDRRLAWQCHRQGLAALYKGRLGRQVRLRGLEPMYYTGRWDILPLEKVPGMSEGPSEPLRESDSLFTVTAVPPPPGAEKILVGGRELHLTVTQPEAGSRDGGPGWPRGRALSLVESCSDEEFDLRAADDRNPPRPSP